MNSHAHIFAKRVAPSMLAGFSACSALRVWTDANRHVAREGEYVT
jgi:hypothetical protein